MRPTVAACLILAGLLPAAAQSKRGAHGGPVVVSDGHPVEMVATDQALAFYLSDDDGSPLSTKGVSARAVLRAEGKTLTVPLTAEPPNKLAGALSTPLAPGSKIVFSAKLHGHSLQARFER